MDCILTEIQIQAPLLLIWQVLTDFHAYSEWNPFMVNVQATFQVGEAIEFVQTIPEGSSTKIKATFIQIEPGTIFRWRYCSKLSFLLAIEQYVTLEAVHETSTRLIHGQTQTGLSVSFLNYLDYFEKSLEGYIAMNHALKCRCEALQKI
jgi:hypothetical protein